MNWTAAALLERFAVHGRYYSAAFEHQNFELRSHLEIFERDKAWPAVAGANADLVAVMMNPGGSRPLQAIDAQGWAPAVPDRTQYQLMKLALHAQSRGVVIRHIRVINLSDIRTPKSAELFSTLKFLKDDSHSLFGPTRRPELQRALGAKTVPVLRAWGLSAALRDLASSAVSLTADRKVLGLTDNQLQYRHPLPQRADLQKSWLEALGQQIEALAPG